MKSLRITPLNLSCALLLAWLLWQILFNLIVWKNILLGFLLLIVMIIADQFFRFFFRTMKRIWLTELGFILFAILVIWVIG